MKMRFVGVLTLSAALAACQGDGPEPTGASPMNAAAVQEDLLALVANPALNSTQQSFLTQIRGRASSAEVHVARMAGTPAQALQQGKPIRLSLAPGRQVVALGEDVEQRGANDLSWGGSLQGEHGSVQLVLTSIGVTASVRTGETLYRIEPLGGGLHAVTRINQAGFPSEHSPENPAGALSVPAAASLNGSPLFSASTSANTVVTVMVAYTAAAASATADIGGLIQLAFDETNKSYANSSVTITLSKVYVAQVSYSESGRSFSQHVNALKSTTDGIMDIVHSWRNTYAADVVKLIVNDSEACGIAAAIKATATSAFAVTHYSCATGYYSFGHEIGHLQGARHDRYVDSSTTPYAYGHGYVDPNKKWRTIMAYGNNCSNCTRVQYWSNPYVSYPSTGQAMGTTTYENNARVLNETRTTVAAFR